MIGRPVVVGVDGSPESTSAAVAAVRLAEAEGVECHLVHATPDVRLELDLAGSGVSLDELQIAMVSRVRKEIEAALEGQVPAAVLDRLRVRTGRPAMVLEELVAECDAGMVVLGGKRHSTLGRWLGGSTVQHAVRRLSVPLLVTAGELAPRPRVLVALDLSYAATPTANGAIAFARLVGGPLRAVHVIEPLPLISEVPYPVEPAVYEAQVRERVERDVWTLLPIPDHEKVIRTGAAFDAIVEEGAAWRAGVIVVGSHGKGWVDRILIGSITEDLLNNQPAAVLVIPVPEPQRRDVVAQPARAALALG